MRDYTRRQFGAALATGAAVMPNALPGIRPRVSRLSKGEGAERVRAGPRTQRFLRSDAAARSTGFRRDGGRRDGAQEAGWTKPRPDGRYGD